LFQFASSVISSDVERQTSQSMKKWIADKSIEDVFELLQTSEEHKLCVFELIEIAGGFVDLIETYCTPGNRLEFNGFKEPFIAEGLRYFRIQKVFLFLEKIKDKSVVVVHQTPTSETSSTFKMTPNANSPVISM
jgi:hypothetical protein